MLQQNVGACTISLQVKISLIKYYEFTNVNIIQYDDDYWQVKGWEKNTAIPMIFKHIGQGILGYPPIVFPY